MYHILQAHTPHNWNMTEKNVLVCIGLLFGAVYCSGIRGPRVRARGRPRRRAFGRAAILPRCSRPLPPAPWERGCFRESDLRVDVYLPEVTCFQDVEARRAISPTRVDAFAQLHSGCTSARYARCTTAGSVSDPSSLPPASPAAGLRLGPAFVGRRA